MRPSVMTLAVSLLIGACALACGTAESEEDAGESGDAVTLTGNESDPKARPFPETDLAKSRKCFQCHKVDAKLIGPSFHEVAAQYMRGRATAEASKTLVDRVAKNIRSGSRQRWGWVPMPENPEVTEEEAQTLARAILESGPGSAAKPAEAP